MSTKTDGKFPEVGVAIGLHRAPPLELALARLGPRRAVARALPARLLVGVVELAPVLEVVPGLLHADAQAVPLRQRRLVPVLHGARRVERLALRVRVVGEEEQVARSRLELDLLRALREHRGAAGRSGLAV